MSTRVYIGLGSNLNNPVLQIQTALEELKVLAVESKIDASALYVTRPVGPQDQPDYINAVAAFDTALDAHALLDELFVIENAHQRERKEKWGARTLDLDLLLYGQQVVSSERLLIPHPHLFERAFVLQPLVDISPDVDVPSHGKALDLLKQCDLSGMKKLTDND